MYWQNYNFYEAEAAREGKPLLRINMDETSVPLVPQSFRGVVMRTWLRAQNATPPRFRAGRGKQRLNLTYVAFVSDDADLNRSLPQFVIVSRAAISAAAFATLYDQAPGLIFLIRSETSWTTAPVLVDIVRTLAAVLRQERPDHAYVLAFDVASSHMAPEVFRALRSARIFPLLVPAKVTWLLQPLDVFCFRLFKERLRRAYYDRFASEQPPQVTLAWFLPVLYAEITRTILEHPWPDIFHKVGLSTGQLAVRSFIKDHLQLENITAPPAVALTEEEVKRICPARRPVSAHYFGALPVPKAVAALPAPAPVLELPPPPVAILPPAPLAAPMLPPPGVVEHSYNTRRQRRRVQTWQAQTAAAAAESQANSESQPASAGEPSSSAWPATPKASMPKPPPPSPPPLPRSTPATPKKSPPTLKPPPAKPKKPPPPTPKL